MHTTPSPASSAAAALPASFTTQQLAAALERRARRGAVVAALLNSEERLQFWKGCADACQTLARGTAAKMAEKDARLAAEGYAQTSLESAGAALPARFKHLSLAEVQQILRAEGIEIAADAVADGNLGARQVLESGVVARFDCDDEHAVSGIDVGHGADCHCVSKGGAAIVAAAPLRSEGGAA
ncbi:hypothetical protein [Xylophilus ampelinus]|uniref:hypothetical protein n=1 Tax=Xylophilus ampelinus TaxID=54067 RepID=UPI001314E35E|nr:hypothetical protein [Xylophilus ampelinus]MCS4508913.1 hypothetical protein [Xylophilus ampelinus]